MAKKCQKEKGGKKIPELMNKLSKVAGYKINSQKSVVFLYIINEQKGY